MFLVVSKYRVEAPATETESWDRRNFHRGEFLRAVAVERQLKMYLFNCSIYGKWQMFDCSKIFGISQCLCSAALDKVSSIRI